MSIEDRIAKVVALEKAGFPEAEIAKAAFDILNDIAKQKGLVDPATPKYEAALKFIQVTIE
jgi:hypothetical protein